MESEEWYETEYEGLTVTRSGKFKWHGVEREPVPKNRNLKNAPYVFSFNNSGNHLNVSVAAVMYKVFVGEYNWRTEVLRYKDSDRSNYAPDNLYKISKAELKARRKIKNNEQQTRRYWEKKADRLKFLENGSWRLSDIGGIYVSSDGRFIRNGRFLTPYKCKGKQDQNNSALYISYREVGLTRHRLRADELIYKTWIGPIGNGEYIMPKDGNRSNLRLDNLYLCDSYSYWRLWSEARRHNKPVAKEKYIDDLRTEHIEIHLAIDYALTDDIKVYDKYIVGTVIPFLQDYCRSWINIGEEQAQAIIRTALSNLYVRMMNRSITHIKRYAKAEVLRLIKKERPSLKWNRIERPSLSGKDVRMMAETQLHLDNEEKYKDI